MTTQPLTKSDWDGHPVWWVRQHEWMSECMVIAISETEIAILQSIDKHGTGSFRCLTWSDLYHLGGERSHDRIHWEPCSKPDKDWKEQYIEDMARQRAEFNMRQAMNANAPQLCTISRAEADKHTITENRVAQPDTVDVEKLIEALKPVFRPTVLFCSDVDAIADALAALHPRLKAEVEK